MLSCLPSVSTIVLLVNLVFLSCAPDPPRHALPLGLRIRRLFVLANSTTASSPMLFRGKRFKFSSECLGSAAHGPKATLQERVFVLESLQSWGLWCPFFVVSNGFLLVFWNPRLSVVLRFDRFHMLCSWNYIIGALVELAFLGVVVVICLNLDLLDLYVIFIWDFPLFSSWAVL